MSQPMEVGIGIGAGIVPPPSTGGRDKEGAGAGGAQAQTASESSALLICARSVLGVAGRDATLGGRTAVPDSPTALALSALRALAVASGAPRRSSLDAATTGADRTIESRSRWTSDCCSFHSLANWASRSGASDAHTPPPASPSGATPPAAPPPASEASPAGSEPCRCKCLKLFVGRTGSVELEPRTAKMRFLQVPPPAWGRANAPAVVCGEEMSPGCGWTGRRIAGGCTPAAAAPVCKGAAPCPSDRKSYIAVGERWGWPKPCIGAAACLVICGVPPDCAGDAGDETCGRLGDCEGGCWCCTCCGGPICCWAC